MVLINLNRGDIVFSIFSILLILILPNRRIHSYSSNNDNENDYYYQQLENNEINKIWFNDYSDNDNFNLFNLFNVFRGTPSKLLDDHGNLIPLDTAKPPQPSSQRPPPNVVVVDYPSASIIRERTSSLEDSNQNQEGEAEKFMRARSGADKRLSLETSSLSNNDDDDRDDINDKRAQWGGSTGREIDFNSFRLKFVNNLFNFGGGSGGSNGIPATDGVINQQIESSLKSDLKKKEREFVVIEQQQTTKITSPVILIPGYGGTRLEAKLKKPSVVRYFCDLESDWSDIWINVKLLLPYMIDCLIDNLRLEYNSTNHTTHNTAGVDIRVKNPSSISSVEYLHQLPLSGFAYFGPIVDKLIESFAGGYERELNVRGAPYDFRKAPNELSEHFENIRLNSEFLYNKNGDKKVTYICHSMGCNQMLYFFHKQSQDWKDKYVKRLISLAAPWAGSFSAMRAAALGDDLGMPYLFSESKLIKVQRSLPSTIFLFPNKQVFSNVPLIRSNIAKQTTYRATTSTRRELGKNSLNQEIFNNNNNNNNSSSNDLTNSNDNAHETLLIQRNENIQQLDAKIINNNNNVNTNNSQEDSPRHYTINDFKSFFDDINHPDGYKMWLDTKDLLGNLEAPGVEVWCLVGKGQKTLGRMEFLGSFPNSPAIEVYDDGDGTVTLESAKYCTNWIDKQKQAINYREFNLSHMAILKDNQVLEYISNILKQN